jgi:hypothetical protein
MKKTLLILAIAAGGALQALAQQQPLNYGFETPNVQDSVIGWHTTGKAKRVNSTTVYVNNQPVTQTATEGSYFLDLRASYDSATSKGTKGQLWTVFPYTAKPVYMQFTCMYLPGAQSGDQLGLIVALTKFNFTTGLPDTIAKTAIAFNPNAYQYPWGKIGVKLTYNPNFNTTPDTAFIYFTTQAGNTASLNTALFIDDIRLEDRSVVGVKYLNDAPLLGEGKVFPNPMTSTATISYTLNENSAVNIDVYDISGRLVKNVFNGNQVKGEQKATFERGNLTPGMYIYKLQVGSQVETGKIMITE